MNNPSPENTPETEWHCGISRNKIHQGYFLSGFLTLGGISSLTLLQQASPDATMYGLILLAGACLIGSMTYRTDKSSGSLLILNPDGLWFKDWNGPVISWKHIVGAETGGTKIKASVRITITDSEAVCSLLDAGQRPAFEKNPLIRLPVLRIPAGSLETPLNEISDKINAFIKKNNA
ncbi:MAG: hypothetical protein HON65_08825 [Rhodospirillales bacterium]|jgi:hypothetical protein|nr:hypothetical protein [Rhodospirillales bacterium]